MMSYFIYSLHKLGQLFIFILIAIAMHTASAQSWNDMIELNPSTSTANPEFGHTVAIQGDIAVVGAFREEAVLGNNTLTEGIGSVYIFQKTNNEWSLVQKIHSSDKAAHDWFGYAVAISGNTIMVGARNEDEDSSGANTISGAGSVYIFENIQGVWTEIQKIVASDRAIADRFGQSIAISGDLAIIGSEDEKPNNNYPLYRAGAAYIFRKTDGKWKEESKVIPADRGVEDLFSVSVSISGDYALVGSHRHNYRQQDGSFLYGAGAAYIFHHYEGNWTQTQKIISSDLANGDNFGISVSIKDNIAVVGARFNDFDENGENEIPAAGAAYVFENHSGNWLESQKIVASDRGRNDRFGNPVTLSEQYIVTGAFWQPIRNTGGHEPSGAGAAYIFEKNSSSNFTETQKLVSTERRGSEAFGSALGVHEGIVIVGADRRLTNFHNRIETTYIFERDIVTRSWQNDQEKSPSNCFPIPVKDNLYIDLNYDLNSLQYEIINNQGEQVSIGIFNQGIDVSNLKTGSYLLKTNNGDAIEHLRFVKE